MRAFSVPNPGHRREQEDERWHREQQPDRCLTTGDVAKILKLTTNGVRRLVDAGRLPCDLTLRGQRIFRLGAVLRVNDQRGKARAKTRQELLAAVRPQVLRAREPRQVAFRLVRAR